MKDWHGASRVKALTSGNTSIPEWQELPQVQSDDRRGDHEVEEKAEENAQLSVNVFKMGLIGVIRESF